MALTAEGRQLTEANGAALIRLAARAASVGLVLWDDLDPSDLDGSSRRWLAENVALTSTFSGQAASTTSKYVEQYREAEGVGYAGPIIRPGFDPALTSQVLLVAGPLRVKNLVGSGMSGSSALAAARSGYAGMLRRQVMMGGRQTIDLTADQDEQAVGWRRVSDGDPCAFCAMLCARGPVYRSRSSAGADPMAGEGMKFHSHCGCHAELVYGSWEPNEQERGFIDQYERAAKQADAAGQSRTQQSVLPRMRADGDFRDSPSVRNKTTQSDQDG